MTEQVGIGDDRGRDPGFLENRPEPFRFLNRGELGGARILCPVSVDLMTANHTADHYVYLRGEGWGSGLGVGVRTATAGDGQPGFVGQYGWGGAAGTHFFVDPREHLVGLMFSQVEGASLKPGFTLSQDFERAVYAAVM